MKRNWKYRLYPNKEQEEKLLHSLEACRQVYNTCLEQRIMLYRDRKKRISRIEQQNQLKEAKGEPAFKGVHSQVLQDPTFRLMRAFDAFYRRVAKKEKPGFPRFKGKNRYHSFTYPQATGFSINPTRPGHAGLRLGCIGSINMRYHREIPEEAVLKTSTILRKMRKWYAIISIKLPDVSSGRVGKPVGLDVGLEKYATISTGEKIPNPRYLREADKRMAKEQRKLRKKLGGIKGQKKSGNYKKQSFEVAKCHERTANRRLDFLHKLTRDLINNYSYIKVENLRITNMMHNHKLAKSIADAGWGTFFQMLAYKAEEAGTLVEFVNPNGTSQTCLCGERVPKTLKDRLHVCPSCGLIADRDWVSAKLIEGRAGTVRTKACGDDGDSTAVLVGVTSSTNQEATSFGAW